MSKPKSVLMVVTSNNRIDDTHVTGIWFEEFALPYREFKSNGFDVTVASPLGGEAPIELRSAPKPEEASLWAEELEVLKQTKTLTSVDAADFDAIFIPGGHGAMFDLPENTTLHKLLAAFAQADKVIGSICHGPAGLVGARLADGTPLVAGKAITAFTNDEECEIEFDGLMPFSLETKLRELGGKFVVQPNWSDHIEIDGNLITGQNPQSCTSIARAMVEAIQSQKPVTISVSG